MPCSTFKEATSWNKATYSNSLPKNKINFMHKILVVEDTLVVREEISDILIMEGYTVFQAEDGSAGFEIALKENPALIISDILMPRLNGFEMFEKLQNNTKTAGISLIFLSAKAEKEDIRKGMNLGAEDYLTKPININDLTNAVENKIKKKIIRDQKIAANTNILSESIKKQKNELNNYAHLISDSLQLSQRNFSDLVSWTQKKLEESKDIKETHRNIDDRWRNLENAQLRNIDSDKIAKTVIDEINLPAHINISVAEKLPELYADEKMIKTIFDLLIRQAATAIDKKIGMIELTCKTTANEYLFSIQYDYVRINQSYDNSALRAPQRSATNETTIYIVKKIITHYKGTLSINTTPNKATVYSFNLPKKDEIK
jgi:DNA-binding response OmpR family regulator